jgi:hypothetical protein
MVRRSKDSKSEIFFSQQDLLDDDRHEFAILVLCHTWVLLTAANSGASRLGSLLSVSYSKE